MDPKNYGQKIVFNRIFESIKLTIKRLIWCLPVFLISYIFSFICFKKITYITVPFCLLFFKLLNFSYDKIVSFFITKKDILEKIYLYHSMQFYLKNIEIYSLLIAFFCYIVSFVCLTKYFHYKGKMMNEGRHFRGLKLVSKRVLCREIGKEIRSKETGLVYTKKDIYVGKEMIRIPRDLGSRMWAYLGVAGSGKSQAIFSQLLQIRAFGDKVIVVDPAGEYCKRFCKKNDVILSLYDVRSEFYSFWEEGLDPMTIATSLIDDLHTGGTPFWSKAGQALFAGLLALNDSPQAMYEMLLQDSQVLKKLFKDHGEAAGVVLGEGEQAGGVLSTAAVDLMWLKNMNHWATLQGKTEPFSIMKWTKNNDDRRWVFLTYADRDKGVAKHLVRLWSDLAVLGAFSRGDSSKNVPIWLVCDELSTIGKLPSMSLLEDRGRKYSMGVIAGFQTPSQLEVIYGAPLARVIIQGLQNIMMFRANEREMLEFMSQNCGDAEYLQITSSTVFGEKTSDSISDRIIKKRNVLPDEFRALKNMNAYLKVSGHNPTPVKVKYLELPKICDDDLSFVPQYQKWNGMINGENVLKTEETDHGTIHASSLDQNDENHDENQKESHQPEKPNPQEQSTGQSAVNDQENTVSHDTNLKPIHSVDEKPVFDFRKLDPNLTDDASSKKEKVKPDYNKLSY